MRKINRLAKLRKLEVKLRRALETCDEKTMAAIARQYRETIREIEEIEGIDETDEISEILNGDGVSGTDGQDRAEL
jgi:hypothetical protein